MVSRLGPFVFVVAVLCGPISGAWSATSGQQTPTEDERAVQTVLDAYADAYTKNDVPAVQRVFPGVDAELLDAQFKQARRQQVRITSPKISIKGDRATVMCRWDADFQAFFGPSRRGSQEITLSLQKQASGWVIIERRCSNCK